MVTVLKADVEDRKQRRIALTLLIVAIVGLAVVGIDYYRKTSVALLPEDTGTMSSIVERWKRDGFIQSFDVKTAELIVNRAEWDRKKRVEKMSLVMQLARFCADQNKTAAFELRVKSQTTGELLAEMGNHGLKVL